MLSVLIAAAFAAKNVPVCDDPQNPACVATLDEAIDDVDAGDTITVHPGTWSYAGTPLNTSDVTVTGYSGAVLDLSSTLEISGDRVVLDQLELVGSVPVLVSVDAATGVQLDDLTLAGHDAGSESTVVVSGGADVSMRSPSFSGSTTTGKGASLRVDGATLALWGENTSFSSDRSDDDGGSIYVTGGATLSVAGGSFVGVSAGDRGGAVYVDSGVVSFDGTTFDGVSAAYGGVVYSVGGTVELASATVTSPTATEGAVVYALVCSADGTQLHGDGADLVVRSSTLREGSSGAALYVNAGTLSATYSSLVGNGQAVRSAQSTTTIDSSLIALHGQQAIVAPNGTLTITHSAFWGNASDGDGAPGTQAVTDDPLLDFAAGSCEVPSLDPASPLYGSSSDGRIVGDWQDVPDDPPDPPDPEPVDTGETCTTADTGRTCDDGVPVPVDTGPFVDTARGQPGPIETADTGVYVVETGSDNDTGPRAPRDTGTIVHTGGPPPEDTDRDSGDTYEPVEGVDDTAIIDRDPEVPGPSGDSGLLTGLTGLTGDTGGGGTADTGLGGTDTDTEPTGTTDTDVDTEPTPPGGGTTVAVEGGQVPFFTCSTAGAPAAGWWLVVGLLSLVRRRR
jgi:hypothetical protein